MNMNEKTIVLDFEHTDGKKESKIIKVEEHYQSHDGFVEFSHYSVKAYTQYSSVEAEGESLEIALHNLARKLKGEDKI